MADRSLTLIRAGRLFANCNIRFTWLVDWLQQGRLMRPHCIQWIFGVATTVAGKRPGAFDSTITGCYSSVGFRILAWR